jgi:helix-turn-helix protein
VRARVTQAETDAGGRPGLASDERAELARLRRENRSLREDVKVLKRATAFEADPVKAHPFIGAEKAAGHGVARACRLLKVSRAACYQRRAGVPSPRAAADAAITARITSIHAESKGTYGSPRIHRVLRRQDVACGKRRVARLMRAAGLEGRRKKRWRTTTIPGPAGPGAPGPDPARFRAAPGH